MSGPPEFAGEVDPGKGDGRPPETMRELWDSFVAMVGATEAEPPTESDRQIFYAGAFAIFMRLMNPPETEGALREMVGGLRREFEVYEAQIVAELQVVMRRHRVANPGGCGVLDCPACQVST